MGSLVSLFLRFFILLSLLSPALASAASVTPMVAAGALHSVALKADGTVVTWGQNGPGDVATSPVAVPGLSGIIAVAAGAGHTVALKADGTVVTWGSNYYGQLGDGTTADRWSPAAVPGLSGVIAVAAGGGGHTAALKADGTVVTWGHNSCGQLGDGTTINRWSPVAVLGLSGVIAVAAGQDHTVALKADGTVVTWGCNTWGQLGDGTWIARGSPLAVPGLSGVVAVAAGTGHTVALKADGTVVAWGWNDFGQVGDGTTTERHSPVTVPGLSRVVSVAAGDFHTVALKADGTVVSWGYNGSGQLGDGTRIARTSPVSVPGLSGVITLAAGGRHAVALKADGTVVSWGGNDAGQLGDGTTTNRLSPVAVSGGLNLGVSPTTLSLSSTSLTFPAQNIGVTSAAQTLALTNSGSAAVNISSIFVSGDYSRTTTCSATLAPGASCGIGVTFAPTAPGPRPGMVTIISNAPGGPHSVSLSGTGLGSEISISPTPLTFAAQVGSTSAVQAITLTNSTPAILNISSIVASGDFAQTTTCGSSVAVGASCAINVTFTPTVSGARSGAVTITSNASGSPHTVSLNGSASVVYGATVTFGGLVVNQTQQAIAGALVTLTMSGITHSATTDASGHFSITFNKTGLPRTLAYLVTKEGYAPLSSGLDLNNGSSLYVGTLVMESLTPSLVVLDLAPGLHHLGDDIFSGAVNSAFQMNAESLYYDREFDLTREQFVATGASITLFLKGAECNNPISINGHVLTYLRGSPADGSFGTKFITVPMNLLVFGQNTLSIVSSNLGPTATGVCQNYDDFEFTNVILRLNGLVLSLKSTTLLTATPPDPVVLGQATTLTAQVNGSSGTPTGNIIFRDGGTPLATATLNASGGATYATNFDARLHDLTASYSGDAVYQPSEGILGYLVTSAVATAIGIRTNPNPSQPGQKVTITANVVPASHAGTLSGTVNVSSEGLNCRITLPDTSCSLSFASKGPRNITASYGGNDFYKASTAATSHFVGQRSRLSPILMLLLE